MRNESAPVHWLGSSVVIGLTVLAFGWRGHASQGDRQDKVWKAFLPRAIQQELVDQSVRSVRAILQEQAKEPDFRQARVEAAKIAAYTLSGDGDWKLLATTRNAALAIAKAIAQDKREEAKKLAAQFPPRKAAPGIDKAPAVLKEHIGELDDLMRSFSPKRRGGNGAELEFLRLAEKLLPREDLRKKSGALELLAYETAVIGRMAHSLAPREPKALVEKFNLQAALVTEAAIELAQAARARSPVAVRQSAQWLSVACANCHSLFAKGGIVVAPPPKTLVPPSRPSRDTIRKEGGLPCEMQW